MVFITHLELASKKNDSYEKKFVEPKSVKITGGDDSNVYEMKKIVAKRKIYTNRDQHRRDHTEFKMK